MTRYHSKTEEPHSKYLSIFHKLSNPITKKASNNYSSEDECKINVVVLRLINGSITPGNERDGNDFDKFVSRIILK